MRPTAADPKPVQPEACPASPVGAARRPSCRASCDVMGSWLPDLRRHTQSQMVGDIPTVRAVDVHRNVRRRHWPTARPECWARTRPALHAIDRAGP